MKLKNYFSAVYDFCTIAYLIWMPYEVRLLPYVTKS